MTPDAVTPLPLHRPVRIEDIRQRGTRIAVATDAAERAGIAAMLDLPSVEKLEARYALTRNGDRVRLEGEIDAALHQTCIVSLDAFPVTLSVPLKLDFAPEEPEAPRRRNTGEDDGEIDIEVRLNEDDPPEPIVDGVIDLGTVTLEFLALALDPYPRKPGAAFAEPAPEEPPESPFAALARLRGKE